MASNLFGGLGGLSTQFIGNAAQGNQFGGGVVGGGVSSFGNVLANATGNANGGGRASLEQIAAQTQFGGFQSALPLLVSRFAGGNSFLPALIFPVMSVFSLFDGIRSLNGFLAETKSDVPQGRFDVNQLQYNQAVSRLDQGVNFYNPVE